MKKKILRSLATIATLCAIVFLGGEWPEETPRKKVITYDGCAIATALVCGLWLRKEYRKEEHLNHIANERKH